MTSALISVGTTLIMVGFVLLAEPTLGTTSEIILKILISFGMIFMATCLFLAQREERNQKIRDQALLINIMAIGVKLGVGLEELMKARHTIDMIDEVNKKTPKPHSNREKGK